MPSFKRSVLAVAASLAAIVHADYYINPDSVSLSQRQTWCAQERSTCPIICQQNPPYTTLDNSCDAETLTYGCVCGNGLQPNVSEYSLTLPFFVCQEWGNQCVKACGQNNNGCASDCRQNHPCGALSPSKPNATSSSSTMSGPTSTSSGSQVYTGLAGGGSNSDSNAAPPAFEAGQRLGYVVLLGGVAAGIALML